MLRDTFIDVLKMNGFVETSSTPSSGELLCNGYATKEFKKSSVSLTFDCLPDGEIGSVFYEDAADPNEDPVFGKVKIVKPENFVETLGLNTPS